MIFQSQTCRITKYLLLCTGVSTQTTWSIRIILVGKSGISQLSPPPPSPLSLKARRCMALQTEEKFLDLKSKGISSTLTHENVDRFKIVITVKRMVYWRMFSFSSWVSKIFLDAHMNLSFHFDVWCLFKRMCTICTNIWKSLYHKFLLLIYAVQTDMFISWTHIVCVWRGSSTNFVELE